MKRGMCVICRITKTKVVKSRAHGKGILNNPINNLPFELHLLGQYFTGPGTKLDKRLIANSTPKDGSKPMHHVDNAIYDHDAYYL